MSNKNSTVTCISIGKLIEQLLIWIKYSTYVA